MSQTKIKKLTQAQADLIAVYREKWWSIARDCGWIYPYDKICVVCEKPIALITDSDFRLHAEGKPAVEFADGYAIYAYRDVILPQWYGCWQPHEWQSQWLLKEQNAEVRRALIQGIGRSEAEGRSNLSIIRCYRVRSVAGIYAVKS